MEPTMVFTTTPGETCRAYEKLGFLTFTVEASNGGYYVCYAKSEPELMACIYEAKEEF